VFLFLAPLDKMPLFIGVTSCLWGLLLLLMKIYFWPCDQLTGVGTVFLSPPHRLVKYWLRLCWCFLFAVSFVISYPHPIHLIIHLSSAVIKVWSFRFWLWCRGCPWMMSHLMCWQIQPCMFKYRSTHSSFSRVVAILVVEVMTHI